MTSTIQTKNQLKYEKMLKPKKIAFCLQTNFDSKNKEPIQRLNADCLLEIFSYLDLIQKVKIESVCRQWFHVLQVRSSQNSQFNLF